VPARTVETKVAAMNAATRNGRAKRRRGDGSMGYGVELLEDGADMGPLSG